MTGHKQWSGAACRTLPYMLELDRILAPRYSVHGQHIYFSTSRLLEPPLWAKYEEESPEEDPLGQQWLPLAHSLPMALLSSMGSLGWHLPWELQV